MGFFATNYQLGPARAKLTLEGEVELRASDQAVVFEKFGVRTCWLFRAFLLKKSCLSYSRKQHCERVMVDQNIKVLVRTDKQ